MDQSFPRGWIKFEIKTNIMGRSMFPDMYFLISLALADNFKQSGGVITAINTQTLGKLTITWNFLLTLNKIFQRN